MRYYFRKGSENTMWIVIIIILALLFLFLFGIPLIEKIKNNSNTAESAIQDCQEDLKGYCAPRLTSESCAEGYIENNVGTCPTISEKCCVVKTVQTPSKECEGKQQGASCGDSKLNSVCNQHGVCITKCEYCSTFPSDTVVCFNQKNTQDKIVNFNSNFGCKCSKTICEDKEKDGKCIKGFCAQSDPMYCCE